MPQNGTAGSHGCIGEQTGACSDHTGNVFAACVFTVIYDIRADCKESCLDQIHAAAGDDESTHQERKDVARDEYKQGSGDIDGCSGNYGIALSDFACNIWKQKQYRKTGKGSQKADGRNQFYSFQIVGKVIDDRGAPDIEHGKIAESKQKHDQTLRIQRPEILSNGRLFALGSGADYLFCIFKCNKEKECSCHSIDGYRDQISLSGISISKVMYQRCRKSCNNGSSNHGKDHTGSDQHRAFFLI